MLVRQWPAKLVRRRLLTCTSVWMWSEPHSDHQKVAQHLRAPMPKDQVRQQLLLSVKVSARAKASPTHLPD